MSNNQFIPPVAAARAFGAVDDDETSLPVNDDSLDEGETNESQATVEEDIREADQANENLDK